ncbi:hypothetical protein [Mesorhizobium sp.]|nr:hypothetical protein [Mesorhizobium sp.]
MPIGWSNARCERAIEEIETKPAKQTTADWLSGIMNKIARSCGPSLLH